MANSIHRFPAPSSGASAPFSDATALVKDDSDPTKQIAFDAQYVSTGTTRTIKLNDGDFDLGSAGGAADGMVPQWIESSSAWRPHHLFNAVRDDSGTTNLGFNDRDVSVTTSINARTVNLDSNPRNGQWVRITDRTNNASVNNITINATGGFTIQGDSSYVIDQDGGSLTLVWNGNQSTWMKVANFAEQIDVFAALAAASGDVSVNDQKIVDLADPEDDQDAATKAYVDANAGGGGGPTIEVVYPAGGTFHLNAFSSFTLGTYDLASKQYLQVFGRIADSSGLYVWCPSAPPAPTDGVFVFLTQDSSATQQKVVVWNMYSTGLDIDVCVLRYTMP